MASKVTRITTSTEISANATNGKAGTIVVWSDKATAQLGKVMAAAVQTKHLNDITYNPDTTTPTASQTIDTIAYMVGIYQK